MVLTCGAGERQRSWNFSHDSEAMTSRCDAISCCCCCCCCDDDALTLSPFFAVPDADGEIAAAAAGEAGRVDVGEVFGLPEPAAKTWQPRAMETARTSSMINQSSKRPRCDTAERI